MKTLIKHEFILLYFAVKLPRLRNTYKAKRAKQCLICTVLRAETQINDKRIAL